MATKILRGEPKVLPYPFQKQAHPLPKEFIPNKAQPFIPDEAESLAILQGIC